MKYAARKLTMIGLSLSFCFQAYANDTQGSTKTYKGTSRLQNNKGEPVACEARITMNGGKIVLLEIDSNIKYMPSRVGKLFIDTANRAYHAVNKEDGDTPYESVVDEAIHEFQDQRDTLMVEDVSGDPDLDEELDKEGLGNIRVTNKTIKKKGKNGLEIKVTTSIGRYYSLGHVFLNGQGIPTEAEVIEKTPDEEFEVPGLSAKKLATCLGLIEVEPVKDRKSGEI